MILTRALIFSFISGMLPSVIWLFYWLKEDEAHPEPNKLILTAFLFGMLTVPIAVVLQWLFNTLILKGVPVEVMFHTAYIPTIVVLILWAVTEEVLKYIAAYFAALKKKENDEPTDVMIYLITASLGFAALENILYLFSPILEGNFTRALITGGSRFIGATLLHVGATSIIGVFVAFSYYKNNRVKKNYLFTGFLLSILLHTAFNSFILSTEQFMFVGMATVWIVVVVIILLFEKIKKIYKPVSNENI